MKDHYTQLPWDQPGWLVEATAWIYAQLEAAGWDNAGPVEILRQRPWATFARTITAKGIAYFKAPAPPFYKAPLTQALQEWRPDLTAPSPAITAPAAWPQNTKNPTPTPCPNGCKIFWQPRANN